jgi:crotonobetainyl-CoA:carnitine CoA-transferase CaiB-like acyl-CoA transferase
MAELKHILDGYKVLDFTQVLAGPTVTRLMAEMGAEIVKVELAPDGEISRGLPYLRNGRSAYFIQQNRGKKSLCVNLRDPQGLALVTELIPQVDVVVENFKPGVIASMGLGYERLKELKSDIILCSISALGQSGPLANTPGYDYIAQAYSGVTSMIGEPDDAPYIPLVGLGDVSTGVHAALAIVSALRYRDRTGVGQHLDIALLDVYYHYHEANVETYSGSGGEIKPTRSGRYMTYACPCGVFRGKGGYLVIMALLHHWKDLCKALGKDELANHPDYVTDVGQRRAGQPPGLCD